MNKHRLRKLFKIIARLVAVILIHEFVLWLSWDRDPLYFQKDRCMDYGGCWDKIEKICRRDEPNAQELCDRSMQK